MDLSATTDEAPLGIRADTDFSSALEAAKLQALYQFAYGLSHEINNPLANIATRAQTLIVDEKDPERRRKLATIVQQAFRAHEMIADLMLFARPPALRVEKCDLVKLADAVVAEMQVQAHEQGTRLACEHDYRAIRALVDRTQIAVALKALVQNSLEAVKSGGEIKVLSAKYSPPANSRGDEPGITTTVHPPHIAPSSVPRPLSPSSLAPHSVRHNLHLMLKVIDTGPGIPSEIRPHIFDPFFSGREAGRGLGLGLSKAWRIIDLHHGQIEVASEPGHGAKFTITLPAELD
jgi:signal transduction histidine kinase